jgi:hypothetical protein
LFYTSQHGAKPDWLAEIFEWVSCADEYSVTARDEVGRIPFSASYFGRYDLDPRVPYGAIAMRQLQSELEESIFGCQSVSESASASRSHFVVNTHDVDVLPLTAAISAKRLAKNAVVSLLLKRSPRLALRQAGYSMLAVTGTHNALDQIPALVAGELNRSAGSTFYFLSSQMHRRDANYSVDDERVVQLLQSLSSAGIEVGIHASYTSLDESDRLCCETERLRQLGFTPLGERQHWLRFTLDRLIPAVERAGLLYDTSLGWSDRLGFRAGVCFAFPPYDFRHERAAAFLEVPLVIMDQAVDNVAADEESRYRAAAEILATSREFGYGGISVLWHPTAFGGCQLPADVGRIFWRLLDDATSSGDAWVSGATFIASTCERYRQAGLFGDGKDSQLLLRRNGSAAWESVTATANIGC